ncbi:MAG: phosphotransferase family protein [Polyangiaceae bacterium]
MTEHALIARDLLEMAGVVDAEPKLSPIHGGRSGALTFQVDVGERRFVLRLQPQERFEEHFTQLVALQLLAGEVRIAPRVIASCPRARALLSEHVPNQPMFPTLRGPGGPRVLRHIGAQLGRLHQLAAPPQLTNRCPTERTLWAFSELGKATPAFVRKAEALARRIPSATGDAVCHLDLNPSNLMFDGERVRIIDWETAGLGDPAFDLATVVNLFVLDPPRAQALYEGYSTQRKLPSEPALFAARQRVYLAYGVEFLRQAAAPAPDWPAETLPRLMDVYAAMSAGQLDMASRDGQWRLGAAYLGELFQLTVNAAR